MAPTIDPKKDYVQIVHNHTMNPSYDEVSNIGPPHNPTYTYRLLLRGIEQTRASDRSIKGAKKLCAYKYLKARNMVARDEDMEALL